MVEDETEIEELTKNRRFSEMKFKGLTIGVPKEFMKGERRVAAISDTVKKMVSEGAGVLVEKGAGVGSYVADSAYAEAGAKIVDDATEVFDK